MILIQYQRENAVFKIAGYFLPTPQEQPAQAFDRAKAECLRHLLAQITHVEGITAEQFYGEQRRFNVTSEPDELSGPAQTAALI